MNKPAIRTLCFLMPTLLAVLAAIPNMAAQACMKPSLKRPGRLYNSCVVDFPTSTPQATIGGYGTRLGPASWPKSPFDSGEYARTGYIQLGP